MWRHRFLTGVMLLAISSSPTWAIPDSDWAFFRAESYSKHSGTMEKTDWESSLYRALDAGPDSDAIIGAFAADIGVPTNQAELFAEALILSVRFREGCGNASCDDRLGSSDWETIGRAARMDPTGRLLISVGENVGGRGANDAIGILRLTRLHPGRLEVLAHLHRYNEDAPYLTALIMAAPADPRTVEAIAWAADDLDNDPDVASGWLDAALEWGLQELESGGAPLEDRAAYAQAILLRRLDTARVDQALALWAALEPDMRERLPVEGRPCVSEYGDGRYACLARVAYDRFGDEMAAALWSAGRRSEAEALMQRVTLRLVSPTYRTGVQRHAAILDAMLAARPPEDLFDLYVDGDPALRGSGVHGRHFSLGSAGWMGADYGPASRSLIVARARRAGYEAVAESMEHRAPYYRPEIADGDRAVMAQIADAFPAGVRALQPSIAASLEAAWTAASSPPEPPAARSRRDSPAAPPAGWKEQPLPAGVATWPLDRRPDSLPDGLALPVALDAVVRYARIGDEHAILYLSSDFDLPGETPAYGIWLARTDQGRWSPPLYLGLQNYFPYVAAPDSALPLIADGQLQIEVRVREIAPRSVSFPPVGLSVARREDGVFISAPLALIERDADADGLTDIAERRLGLNPDRADTDGDGMIDGSDPLPLTRFEPSTPATVTAFARAIVSHLADGAGPGNMIEPVPEGATAEERVDAVIGSPAHRPLDTVIMQGDPALFAGLSPDFRLMVYDEGELDRLTEGATPFYPPKMTIYSSLDGLSHYVVWSARWVGGSFTVRCPANGEACAVEEKSNWIT